VECIPEELRRRSQWVLWRYIPRGGSKPEKKPFQPRRPSYGASVNDPETWGTIGEALTVLYAPCRPEIAVDGIGFMFARDDPY
jgi:primase-polymerase (primpol)-like protein